MQARRSDQLPIARLAARATKTSLTMAAILAVSFTGTITQGLPADAAQSEPAEPSPNAQRPLTHEELLAIRGERGRFEAWGAETLVAEAVLKREPPLRDGDDWSGEGPAFGVIAREGSHPGAPVVLASEDVAAQYSPDDSPISGLLAISDTRSDGLQLQGTVETPTGTYLTPIEPTAMATADALPVGALIVVHGWFSNLPSVAPCPDVPDALDPNDSGGRYSPFVRCPGGWLTVDDVSEVEPDDRTTPVVFGIPVQPGALELFGRRALSEPRAPASYLLRHVANPVDGAEPATGWQVIGRVGPVTIPDLDPPTDRDEVARPGGLDWQPGMDRQPPADTWGLASTAWDGGFAATGTLDVDRVNASGSGG